MVRLFCFIGLFLSISSFGQSFQNIRSRLADDKIIIIYDLISLEPGSRVNVSLYSSHNNFESPLENVSGDVGLVLPGPNRRIIWNAPDPTINIDSISFRFKGEVMYGLRFTHPSPAENIKRGVDYHITWKGGLPSDTVTLTLFNPDQERITLAQMQNTGSFKWTTEEKMKIGKGYVLRISTRDNAMEERFSIKRKVPRGLFVVPVLGTAVFILLKGGGSGNGDLPDAPSPN